MSRLVIVESPTKAKTIQKFLPKGYQVEACMGHVRDLPADAEEIPDAVRGRSWARLGVNIEDDFAPLYVIPTKKQKVVRDLRAALKGAEELIVATDEDREGESIGWHLMQVLKPKIPVRRMVFHEITREAIEESLKNYRSIDEKLVRAQETRRILDRLVGYTVSPLLWKKVAPGLSAGRVQSVAVRLLVRREEQRREFHTGTFWDLLAELSTKTTKGVVPNWFEATLNAVDGVRVATGKDFDETTGHITIGKKVLLLNEEQTGELRARLQNAVWQVMDTAEKAQNRKPPPPFTTSTLQQEANRKLKLPTRDTMRIAQKLYEEGHITYMRTDSVHLSNEAIGAARQAIGERYGADYLSDKPRQYTTQSKGAQEAHEAIRPAGSAMRTAEEIGLHGVEAGLYDMIWKRTMASQMAEARLTLITVTIQADNATFQANGKRIDFPGFFRVYVEGTDDPDAALDDRAVLLPPMKPGDSLNCRSITPVKHETQPPARFTEASLVQTLEREGVGRPSTYATIIGTVQDRGYVTKTGNQLIPTFTALAVNRLLEVHFPSLVDTQFTARMEQSLDEIADGEVESLPYLKAFYLGENGLETLVAEKTQSIDPRTIYAMALSDLEARVRIGKYGPYIEQQMDGSVLRTSIPVDVAPADLTDSDAERLLREKEKGPDTLGWDPVSGRQVFALTGRFGPYVQLGTPEEAAENPDGKPKRASLLKGMTLETITLDTALALLALPRMLGIDPADATSEQIEAGVGPLGPFVRRGKDYRSLTATDDVLTVGLDRALELFAQPKALRRGRTAPAALRDLGIHPEDGKPVQVMNGRYGPYVKHGDINATLPRGTTPDTVTLTQALALIAERAAAAPTKKKVSKRASSTTTKATKTATSTKASASAKTTKLTKTVTAKKAAVTAPKTAAAKTVKKTTSRTTKKTALTTKATAEKPSTEVPAKKTSPAKPRASKKVIGAVDPSVETDE